MRGIPSLSFMSGLLLFLPINPICRSNRSVYNRLIGPVDRVFANGPGDLGSIPFRAIPKTLKIVLDTPLLNIQ